MMAKASHKHAGPGSQGKRSGTGAMTDDPVLPENAVLSNRDKANHPGTRGHDSKWTQVEQLRDTATNQKKD